MHGSGLDEIQYPICGESIRYLQSAHVAPPLSERWLKGLKQWFCNYSGAYKNQDPEHDYYIDLKQRHSLRVCAIMRRLGRCLSLTDAEQALGQAIGLLHDLGRFDQFARYGTLSDARSLDHGEYGARLIAAGGLLGSLNAGNRSALLAAVRNHNKVALDKDLYGPSLFWAGLIRDADKLDIWELVTVRFLKKPPPGSALGNQLSKTDGVSAPVMAALKQYRCIPTAALRTRYDQALFHMGWVFDLNHDVVLRQVLKCGYLDRLHAALPPNADFDDAYRRVRGYAQARLGVDKR